MELKVVLLLTQNQLLSFNYINVILQMLTYIYNSTFCIEEHLQQVENQGILKIM